MCDMCVCVCLCVRTANYFILIQVQITLQDELLPTSPPLGLAIVTSNPFDTQVTNGTPASREYQKDLRS